MGELETGSGIQKRDLARGGHLEPTVVERAAPMVCVRVPEVSTENMAAGTGLAVASPQKPASRESGPA